MSAIITLHDIVEDNGKTIKENNMEKPHNIPIGSLVEVTYDTWFGEGACEKVIARLFVVQHTRDCDGTPMYSLCKNKTLIYDDLRIMTSDSSVFRESISRYWLNGVKTGFVEENLKVIEQTEDVIKGVLPDYLK